MFAVMPLVVAVFGTGLEPAAKLGPGQVVGQGPSAVDQVCQETTDLAGAVGDQANGAFGATAAVAAVTAR